MIRLGIAEPLDDRGLLAVAVGPPVLARALALEILQALVEL